MSSLLALQTSGAICSVCLHLDGTRFEVTEHVERRHNELLLSMLNTVCERADVDPGELGNHIDAVAFGCGPGSFTGVRIAAAAAQAIALASAAQVVPVISSQALALAAFESCNGDLPEGMITLIRSRATLYYLAAYQLLDGYPVARRSDSLTGEMPQLRAQDGYAGWRACGEQPQWWAGPIAVVHNIEATADQICSLGLRSLELETALDAAEGLPLYVSGDSPWRLKGG